MKIAKHRFLEIFVEKCMKTKEMKNRWKIGETIFLLIFVENTWKQKNNWKKGENSWKQIFVNICGKMHENKKNGKIGEK